MPTGRPELKRDTREKLKRPLTPTRHTRIWPLRIMRLEIVLSVLVRLPGEGFFAATKEIDQLSP